MDAGSVDLVFTDPPYHDKTLTLYEDLGHIAMHVLKDGASLITYIAHHRLPEIIAMLQAAGLTFFWPLAITIPSPHARMREYGIVVTWKPLLWFVKGKFRRRDHMQFVTDRIESPRQEKQFHPWQQGIPAAQYYIDTLTQPGDLVFDPFCGGGTTAVAAAKSLRRWVTCDIDEQSVHLARQRIRQAREAVA
jgi:DNA modification methylase